MQGRINNFDGLRLIAAAMVLISHQFALMGYEEPFVTDGCSMGRVGVLIFFGISGYLISESWARDPDLGRFLARRYLRLLPALLVCVPLVEGVIYLTGNSYFPDNPLRAHNGSLWTIKMEVLCYLLLVGLSMMAKRRSVVFTVVMLVAWAVTSSYNASLSMMGVAFGVGMLLHEYPRLRSGEWLIAFLVIGCAAYLLEYSLLSVLFVVPPLAIWIGERSWPAMRDFGNRGDFSYGVYIYAFLVQQMLIAYLGADQPYLLLLLASFACVVPLAVASWVCIEAPALRHKPSAPKPAPVASREAIEKGISHPETAQMVE